MSTVSAMQSFFLSRGRLKTDAMLPFATSSRHAASSHRLYSRCVSSRGRCRFPKRSEYVPVASVQRRDACVDTRGYLTASGISSVTLTASVACLVSVAGVALAPPASAGSVAVGSENATNVADVRAPSLSSGLKMPVAGHEVFEVVEAPPLRGGKELISAVPHPEIATIAAAVDADGETGSVEVSPGNVEADALVSEGGGISAKQLRTKTFAAEQEQTRSYLDAEQVKVEERRAEQKRILEERKKYFGKRLTRKDAALRAEAVTRKQASVKAATNGKTKMTEFKELKKAQLRAALNDEEAKVAERQAKQGARVSERNSFFAQRQLDKEKAAEEAKILAADAKLQKRDELEQAAASAEETKAAQQALIADRKRAVVEQREAKNKARESEQAALDNRRQTYCIEGKTEYCQE